MVIGNKGHVSVTVLPLSPTDVSRHSGYIQFGRLMVIGNKGYDSITVLQLRPPHVF